MPGTVSTYEFDQGLFLSLLSLRGKHQNGIVL